MFRFLILFLAIPALFLVPLSCAAVDSEAPSKPHHSPGGFRNVYLTEDHGFFHFLRWQWERIRKTIPDADSYEFPLADNDPSYLRENGTETTLTWIGHATVLLQLKGKNILTDPQFSERASPVQWAGPGRAVPPGLRMDELPPIDLVVISHDHYDSLDFPTIRQLARRNGGDRTVFLVPLGMKKWFEKNTDISRVIELDWWEEHGTGGLRIVAVPMQHWSKRSPFSRNTTLWAGWAIISPDFRFYFAGDTGYSQHFSEIGDRLGPFDLSAIPIGAYEPRWFMRNHHVNPAEAVQIHLDVRSQKTVGIHWGTFVLTDEPLDEPPLLLSQAVKERGLDPGEFTTLVHGQTIILGKD